MPELLLWWHSVQNVMTPAQWGWGIAAALMVGMSKTGVPGLGILVVNLLVLGFGGWESVGLMLPMLIFGDLFAVVWYKRHADWKMLARLLPWVLGGLAIGFVALKFIGQNDQTKLWMNPIIGSLVLLMLVFHLLEKKLGSWLTGKSGAGLTGVAAGFTTTVSNAAGPIMSIFLTAQRFPKEQFMGTIAWYFFTINLTKVPLFILQDDMLTLGTLKIAASLFPAILIGAFAGKWLFTRIPQALFTGTILALAGIGAAHLVIDNLLKLLRP